jgi:hypothetical protein
MERFKRRHEYSNLGFVTDYNLNLLNHFYKTCERKLKKANKFLIEEVTEILFYKEMINKKSKPIVLKASHSLLTFPFNKKGYYIDNFT